LLAKTRGLIRKIFCICSNWCHCWNAHVCRYTA